MFFRTRRHKTRIYIHIVENYREGRKRSQRVIANIGRLDRLQDAGVIDALIRSASRLSNELAVLPATGRSGTGARVRIRSIGPELVFGQLWDDSGIREVFRKIAAELKLGPEFEQAVFAGVLQRIVFLGKGENLQADLPPKPEISTRGLHQRQIDLAVEQLGKPMSNRSNDEHEFTTVKRCIEEELFRPKVDMFSALEFLFAGPSELELVSTEGESTGNPDSTEVGYWPRSDGIFAVVNDQEGIPVSVEEWPNASLSPGGLETAIQDFVFRFGARSERLIFEQVNLGNEVFRMMASRGWEYIAGTRPHKQTKHLSRFLSTQSDAIRQNELAVKEFNSKRLEQSGRRIITFDPSLARNDKRERAQELAFLAGQLSSTTKRLARLSRRQSRFVELKDSVVQINTRKLHADASFDGMRILRTNSALPAEEIAFHYRKLYKAKQHIQNIEAYPVADEDKGISSSYIRGHILCFVLAEMLRETLLKRISASGESVSWDELFADLEELKEVEIELQGKHFKLYSDPGERGMCAIDSVGASVSELVERARVREHRG